MILCIFVENKGEGFDYRTSQRFATVWLHPAGYEWGCQQGSVVRPDRFELPTPCFVGKCSIQLSYGRTDHNKTHILP